MTYVLLEDGLVAVVKRLLQRLGHLGIHATVLYLDKGFCCGEIIRYLLCNFCACHDSLALELRISPGVAAGYAAPLPLPLV